MKSLKIMTLTLLAGLVSACATQSDAPSMSKLLAKETVQNGRACFRQSDIRGFGVPDSNLVSIDGRQKYYLATVLPGCINLQTSARAFFSGDFFEVCGQTGDRIVTRDESCTINQVFEFETRDQAFETLEKVKEQSTAENE